MRIMNFGSNDHEKKKNLDRMIMKVKSLGLMSTREKQKNTMLKQTNVMFLLGDIYENLKR